MSTTSYRLLVHYMCPFARRALYAAAFKQIKPEIVECDLSDKSEELMDCNPTGTVPALIATRGSESHKLYESLEVMEIFDEAAAGPYLFPRDETGSVDTLKRARMRCRISQIAPALTKGFVFFRNTLANQAEGWLDEAQAALSKLNDLLAGHTYLASDITGYEEISAVDIAALPFVEWWFQDENTVQAWFDGVDISNLRRWYQLMEGMAWREGIQPLPHRTLNLNKALASGNYRGLELPLSKYD